MTDASVAGPESPVVPISNIRLPLPVAEVLCHEVPEGAVLLHTRDEVYFGLNSVGAIIWSLLLPGRGTLDELVAELAVRFPGVDAEVLRADCLELLDALLAAGLVRPAAADPTRPATR